MQVEGAAYIKATVLRSSQTLCGTQKYCKPESLSLKKKSEIIQIPTRDRIRVRERSQ